MKVARGHILLSLVTVLVALVGGVLMRVHLFSPSGLLLARRGYEVALGLHGAMAGLMTTLPLLALVGASSALPRWRGGGGGGVLALAALAAHSLAVGLYAWTAIAFDRELIWGPPLLTITLLVLLLALALQAAVVVRELARGRWRRSPLAWAIPSATLLALVLMVPPALVMITSAEPTFAGWPFADSALWTDLDTLVVPIIVGILALGWALELVVHRGWSDKVIGIMLLVALLAFVIIAPRIDSDLHIADSYVTVGTRHLLHGMAVVCAGLALLRPAHVSSVGRLLACLIAFFGMCAADMLIGMNGMPRRYLEYDPVLTSVHRVASALDVVFVLALIGTLWTWWRARPVAPLEQTFD